MKSKKRIINLTIMLWTLGIVIFIGGNLLGPHPVRALNQLAASSQTSPLPEPTGEPTLTPTDEPTPTPTDEPTSEPTAEPTPNPVVLAINGPNSLASGETVQLTIEAQGLTDPGLYGAQVELNFDPTLLSVNNLQVNPNFTYVLRNNADNTLGKLSLVASQQGAVPGLTGPVTLLTFEVTAIGGAGPATLSFENTKLGDPQANPLTFSSQDFTLQIDGDVTPAPTDEPTPVPTDEPTPVPTDEPTPVPTDEPTPVPTDEPTPEPTGEPTPEPTDEPGTAVVFGQVILAGRFNNNWSDATVTVDDTGESATTDTGGNFSIANVTPGSHTSLTADAPGYLPAVCTTVTVTAPETALTSVNLLSGDINDDAVADIADATAIGVGFGQTGADLPADINRDEVVDIFDVILVSVNFGQGAQTWDCLAE